MGKGSEETMVLIKQQRSHVSTFRLKVWSVVDAKESVGIRSNSSNEIVPSIKNLKDSPIVYNILFSGQKSNGLVLWRTRRKGNGQNCFARLSYKGELAIRDDAYESASEKAPIGEYVLVIQQNGEAVIYRPEILKPFLHMRNVPRADPNMCMMILDPGSLPASGGSERSLGSLPASGGSKKSPGSLPQQVGGKKFLYRLLRLAVGAERESLSVSAIPKGEAPGSGRRSS
ncbi:hypothetical protein IEQ34_020626 [Dendrobium chrysotoxum]|uniref:Uncharacterized protein n=1 Tax=Dendrobium chrysotoxum TaxID=161865 RepID=A0AAV7G1J0_DENCH|nr:hypothetical protein IEQ34_020626 [Dendrobium chrysotoxum]